ncbi:MAG: hypothetical protein R3F14_47610, partial [Polyangiaceae bacterium]
ESDHIPAARPPGGTTPGVVPRHVAPRPDPTESGALERPAPGDAPGSRRHAAKATEPAFGQGVGATAETTSTQDEELPPPPEWYLNTPIVGREAWEIDEDAEPELIDDEIDYTQIEEYDPRDDPDMERVA